MRKIKYPPVSDWNEILKRPAFDPLELEGKVMDVLKNIRDKGDEALAEYTQKFDGVSLNDFVVSQSEFLEADKQVSDELKRAIELAELNIRKFHESQWEQPQKIETMPGVTCWRESRPIEKVGLYIPGGTAPLFSTILMLAVPAKVAGCKELVLCTPPAKDGSVNPAILFTAKFLGIDKVIKAGGAQAIAAMTFGTQTVTAVDKIFGPGNQYVTAAKQLATRYGVSIDMPAGPSEVQVIADETADPAFVAADLLSQAEHGSDSQVILVTTSEELMEAVEAEVNKQLSELPRKEFATGALENSRLILVNNREEVIQMTNMYAPEHLIIETKDYESYIPEIINAGSVFLGHFTPESAGDYASGTNHTLPTNGFARSYSGVSLDSFIKKVTFQEISREGIQNIGTAVEVMAEAEHLFAHKNAVTLRKNKK